MPGAGWSVSEMVGRGEDIKYLALMLHKVQKLNSSVVYSCMWLQLYLCTQCKESVYSKAD